MKQLKRYLKNFWNYFRPSWEGPDNNFSYKRFSQFLWMLLIARQLVNGVHDQWSFYAFLTLAVLFSLTATIIGVPDLIKLVKYGSQIKKTDYYTPGTNEAAPIEQSEPQPSTTVITETKTKPPEIIPNENNS